MEFLKQDSQEQQQLKDEFQNMLFKGKHADAVPKKPDLLSSLHLQHKTLSKEDVQRLKSIAEILRSTDHFQECVRIYIKTRKDTVDTAMYVQQLQIQKEMNFEPALVFAHWEAKIQWWIQISRVFIRNIFMEEKFIYDQIFCRWFGIAAEDAADQGYVHIVADAAAKLFEFPNSLMNSRHQFPQKLEILLPLYQEILYLMPDIDSLFPKDLYLTINIHENISRLVLQLTQLIKLLLSASERHVLRELSLYPTPGGGIHPLTEYVVNYIHLIFVHRKPLSDLIGKLEGYSNPSVQELISLETNEFQTTPLKHHLIRIIGFLLYNLRYKCKFYDHESLGHLFMMNNVHHIAQKIVSSQGLQEIFGYNYLMKLRDKVKEAMTNYLKTSWNVVFCCLTDDRSKPRGKWSSLFDKSNRADTQLKKKLQRSILDELIPAYIHFLDQHKSKIDKLQHPEMYIQYSVKELDCKIFDMFSSKTRIIHNVNHSLLIQMTLLHQMSSSVHGSDNEATAQEILVSKLSLQFRDTLLKTPVRAGEVDIKASDSTNHSISISDSTSLTLHYEDYRTLHGLLEAEEIECLRAIAQTLNSTNNLQECLLVYTGLQKDTVNLIFERLIEKMNSKAVCFSKNWEELGDKIQLWIQVAKICVVNIFVKEKSLYEQIFGGLGTIKEGDGFTHIIGSAAAELFGFADSLMMRQKMPQRLEILLPIYQDLLDLMPFLNVLFDRDLCLAKNIHACATGILFRIAQHMTRILSASERQVLGELSVIPISGGNIHPMTEYVIHYMELISDHKNSLTELIVSSQVFNDLLYLETDAAKTHYQEHEPTPLKHHAARIIEFLLYNLSYKSSFYEQESLGHLFMMNNIHHVAQRIKISQRMQEIVDRDLYRKLTEKVEQEMSGYVKTTWDRICGCLIRYQRSISISSSIKWKFFSANSTKSMKQKFKNFNHRFEDVLQTQTEWAVRDQQLREKLHQSILEKLIPAYCRFLEQFSSRIEKVQYPERYIKYSVKDLYIKILNLFHCQERL